MALLTFVLEFSKSAKSLELSEKKATSEPDTSELATTNKIKATKFTIRYDGLSSESCASKVKLGSGSSVGKSKL